MPTRHHPWLALLVLLTVLFVAIGPAGLPSEAAPATLQPQATIQRGAVRSANSPTVLGDINNDGIVDIRDYGIWRQNFGQTGPTVTPTPTTTPTATPTATPLPGRAYVANSGSANVTVIDTTTNFVSAPIPVGTNPRAVGVDPTVHRAYVVNNGSNTVTVIDTTTNTVVGAPIPVGTFP